MRENFEKRFFGRAIISSEKPIGQQISAMVSVFNILIHEIYRKYDKNCIKTLKIGIFFSFLGLFLSRKPH